MSIKKAIDILKIYGSFIITAHINPEGDSLGSQLALCHLLEKMGKKAVMINDHKVPGVYQFLPKSNLIRSRLDKRLDYDVAIVLDCPTLDRIGKVKDILDKGKIVLNIDHHISNEKFGKINWVDPKASSCGEMIYNLFKEADCEIDKDSAINLYVAILTDTGSFKYSNTTSKTHRIVGELLDCGLDVSKIQESIYERRSMGEIKLLSAALSNLQVEGAGRIAYTWVTREMAKECGINIKGTEEFINFPRSLDNAEIALFFREEKDGNIHVSFRSTSDADVNKIAAVFGGGGHTKASGCLIKGNMKEVREKVLSEVKKTIEEGSIKS